MATHACLLAHIVFGTKFQEPSLAPAWRGDLHAQLGGCIKTQGAIPILINGVADHVHMLVNYRPSLTLSDLVRDAKRETSAWVHQSLHLPSFAWQEGFGVFSVSKSGQASVERYIANQEKHHRKKSFRDEFETFLKKHKIEFTPEYML